MFMLKELKGEIRRLERSDISEDSKITIQKFQRYLSDPNMGEGLRERRVLFYIIKISGTLTRR